jgi:lactococcin 972 family bacteriocin
MKNIKRLTLRSVMVVGIVLASVATSTAASAADVGDRAREAGSADAGAPTLHQSYPGGGTWNYGVGPLNVYSHYSHKNDVHKATACAGTKCAYSGWVQAGALAAAAHPKARSGNTAYWGIR